MTEACGWACVRCGIFKAPTDYYKTHDNRPRRTCKRCVLDKMAADAKLKTKRVTKGRIVLGPYDETPCRLCGLRGHLPGDPDRCLDIGEHRSTGMGNQGWV